MNTYGFIGGYDKTDLILYVAKILATANKKVLYIDATLNQKAKYTIPAMNPTRTYITEFEGIDFAVGFKNMEEITEYLGIDANNLEYDIVLQDIDSPEAFQNFDTIKNYRNCFVTGFDLYSLKKGLEILSVCRVPVQLTKVYFSTSVTKDEDNYLNYLAEGYKLKWAENIINFPLELGNYSVNVENQIVSRIKIKRLTNDYKSSLEYLMKIVFNDDLAPNELSQTMKYLEKEI